MKKAYRLTSLRYSIAKYTLKTPLTFSKVEKTKHENFDFVHLLSSSSFFFFFFFFFFSIKHNSNTIRCVQTLSIPNDCSANEDYSYLVWAVYKLRLESYGLKTVSNMLCVLLRTLLSFSRNNCVGKARMVRPHPDYWTRALHAGEVTGSDEFAKKYLCVSRSSFIVFSINLVYLKTV